MNAYVNPAKLEGFGSAGGVVGHSTPVAFTGYAVFCVGNDFVREAAFRAWALGEGIAFKNMVGCYKGISEHSFMVRQHDLGLCYQWWKDQESILFLSPLVVDGVRYGARKASLWFVKGGDATVPLGFMKERTKAYALAQEAWSFDIETGTYWVAP